MIVMSKEGISPQQSGTTCGLSSLCNIFKYFIHKARLDFLLKAFSGRHFSLEKIHCLSRLWLGGNNDVNLLILVGGDTGQLIVKHRVVIVGCFLIGMTFHG